MPSGVPSGLCPPVETGRQGPLLLMVTVQRKGLGDPAELETSHSSKPFAVNTPRKEARGWPEKTVTSLWAEALRQDLKGWGPPGCGLVPLLGRQAGGARPGSQRTRGRAGPAAPRVRGWSPHCPLRQLSRRTVSRLSSSSSVKGGPHSCQPRCKSDVARTCRAQGHLDNGKWDVGGARHKVTPQSLQV